MKGKLLPEIDSARCTGCGRCVAACPPHVLSLERRGWVKAATLNDTTRCTGCAACEAACPFSAVVMRKEANVQRQTALPPLHLTSEEVSHGLGRSPAT